MGRAIDPYDDGQGLVSRLTAVIFFGVLALAGSIVSAYFVLMGIRDVPRGSQGYPVRELTILKAVAGVDIAIAVIAALAILTFAFKRTLLFKKPTAYVGALILILAIILIGVSISAVVLLYRVALLEPFHIIATGASAAAGLLGITFGSVIMTAKHRKRDSFASYDATAPSPTVGRDVTKRGSVGNADDHLSTPKTQWNQFESGSSDNLIGSPQSPALKGSASRDSYNSFASPQSHYKQAYSSRPSTGNSDYLPANNNHHGAYPQDPLQSPRAAQAGYAQQQQQSQKYGNVAPNAPKQRSNLGATDPLTAHAGGSTPSINVTPAVDSWQGGSRAAPAGILKPSPELYGAEARRKSYEANRARPSYETARTQPAAGGAPRRQSQEQAYSSLTPAAANGEEAMAWYGGSSSSSSADHMSTYDSNAAGVRSSQPYGGVLADYGVRASAYGPPPSSQSHASRRAPSPAGQAPTSHHDQYAQQRSSPLAHQEEWKSKQGEIQTQRSEYHDAQLASPQQVADGYAQADEGYGQAYSGYEEQAQAYGHPEQGDYHYQHHHQQQQHRQEQSPHHHQHQAYAYNGASH
ncbi:hypothetical protein IE81DRAFT_117503 [Ceraceosorus guamensis]|uniref:Uncharacterized protein n=1 Tax=Ceraceosorus guamensis TaxID=1522189 RepID=A0A316VYX4_9BASI|nr:hypothetical protein IE81DRAFT_117503 [Ceraceosorus guamensis]PWN42659.1 hypothetical protein IE81DRAFT_117503 [Ceraceosorus guamensis]